MKCVRCGVDTRRKSSFCKECEDFIRKDGKIIDSNENVAEEDNFNLGYFMVMISVMAVAAMIAFMVFCFK